MDKANRRAAVAAYKEQKPQIGVFAVRCASTGQCWVGTSPNLPAAQNRVFFALRLGSSPHRTLQAAWRQQPESSFTFEVLERLPEDLDRLSHPRVLKERLAHWKQSLGAEQLC